VAWRQNKTTEATAANGGGGDGNEQAGDRRILTEDGHRLSAKLSSAGVSDGQARRLAADEVSTACGKTAGSTSDSDSERHAYAATNSAS